MTEKKACVGNREIGTKSDCYVELELQNSGGIQLELKSKVGSLFGKSITKLTNEILSFYDLKNVKIYIEDTGAVEFVLAARIEAAIKKLVKSDKDFLLNPLEQNKQATKKDMFRISRLYLPGNTPKLMLNAGIHKPNGLILDLEDAVSPKKKYEARFVVRNALRNLHFYGAERMVRINQGELAMEDLKFIVPHYHNLILIPKCETSDDVIAVDTEIQRLKKENKSDLDIWLMPIIESAKVVMNAYQIATASKNISSMAIGLEDYTADLGVQRTDEATESFFARNMLVNAARAAGIQSIDSVFSDVSNMEALAENVQKSKGLGFDGMGCIHPRQIRVIHDNFAPSDKEIEKAKRIYLAFLDAKEKGLGVVSLGTKMIDAPVVKRAETTIRMAENSGKLDKNWKTA
ncbi:MAG: citrate lyase ACP [Marinilabiliales bacterium]|nr:MAG: citrate lyase ACP [Marinilabiliales bacterium]